MELLRLDVVSRLWKVFCKIQYRQLFETVCRARWSEICSKLKLIAIIDAELDG